MTHDHAHDHTHGRDHHHGRHHAPGRFGMSFAVGTVLNLGFVVAEVIYGIHANALSLVADAGHNLGDVFGLVLAWIAMILSRRLPTKRHTYGMRSASILAALANAIILLMTVGGIAIEAVIRFMHPVPVMGTTVMWVAASGIVINGVTALLFISGRKGDVNIRAAFSHMVADATVSAGVVVAGLVIAVVGWQWVDPLVSLVIAGVIIVGTWGLLGESLNLALDAVPEGVDSHTVETYLVGLPGVTEVHDLHIWGMSTTDIALTAHLVIPTIEDHDTLLLSICRTLHDRFGIAHTTVQIEHAHAAATCDLAPAHVV